MNDSETIVQTRIEKLKAGESLADNLSGLAETEAELVRRAASLQQISLPEPEATAVAAQRAAVIAAARHRFFGNGDSAPSTLPLTLKQRLNLFWQALFPHREILAGLAFVLLLIFFFAWFGRGSAPDPASLTASLPQDDKTAVTASDNGPETATAVAETSETETTAAPAAETAAVDPAATTAALPNQLFMPVLHTSLLAGPDKAALHNLRGLVEIDQGDGLWTAVSQNTHLVAGSRIRTGRYSSASLAFYDGSQASLGPEAELSLDEVNALPPGAGFRTVVMTQWAGLSSHQVQFRHDGGSRYEVQTASGSGIARGTQFQVNVGASGRNVYTVTEGKVDVSSNGRTVSVIAGQTTSFTADDPPDDPTFIVTGTGTVSQMGDVWIIAGQAFSVTTGTLILGQPEIGDLVYVEGHLVANGSPPVADLIQRLDDDDDNTFTLTGEVEAMNDNAWIVAGQAISLTADTQIEPGIEIGDMVQVEGIILPPDGHLVATAIIRLEQDDEMPFEFVGVVQNISAGAWTISGVTVTIDEETEIEEGIAVGDTVKVEGIILADDTWLAQEIKLLEDDDATFTFTGAVMDMDPWLVAGIGFEVADWAHIDPGIEIGDTVRVSGLILADGTWLATDIELLTGNVLQIVFVGEVNEIDPWLISGLPLTTDENTVIEGDIAIGDLVRVTAWIRDDGTWLATHILRLDTGGEQGCVAITAVIIDINGDELILSNGQTILLGGDIVVDGELQPGSVVLITACVQDDGTILIVSIIVIYTPPPPTPPSLPPPGPPGGGNDGPGSGDVTICHKPGTPAEQTKTVPQPALGAHLGHGDTMGPCD